MDCGGNDAVGLSAPYPWQTQRTIQHLPLVKHPVGSGVHSKQRLEWRLSVGGHQRRVGCDWTLRRIWSIEGRISGEAYVKSQSVPAASGKQLGQVRGADGLDQVPLDPGLARELATGMLTVSRQGNQSQGL